MLPQGRTGLVLALAGAVAFAAAAAAARPVDGGPVAATESVPRSSAPPTLEQVRALNASGRYAEAEALGRTVLAAIEREHGADSLETADALGALFVALSGAGKAREPEARDVVERGLAIRRKVLGPDHVDVATSLNNLGTLLHAAGDLAGARRAMEEAIEVGRRAHAGDTPAVASLLFNLSTILEDMGDVRGARARLDEALAILRHAPGQDDPTLAAILHSLAALAKSEGNLAAARAFAEEALATARRAHGPDHPEVAEFLTGLGSIDKTAGNLASARTLYEEALALRRRTLRADHPYIALSLNNLAGILQDAGDLAAARPLYEQSLAATRQSFGAQSFEAVVGLSNLAGVMKDSGDYAAARNLYEQAIPILKATRGPEHPIVASLLNNVAVLLTDAGDAAAARPLLEEALAINEKALGPAHPQVAGTIGNLARVLKAMGDFEASRGLFERSLASLERTLGPDHAQVATTLNNLATLMRATGNARDALPLQERALRIQEGALGPEHATVGATLGNLATLHFALGDLARARALQERSLEIQTKALGRDHHAIARAEDYLATMLAAEGRVAEALDHALRSEALGRDHLDVTASALSLREALRYARARPGGLAVALSIVARGGADAAAVRATWDAGLRSRARVLDAIAARQQSQPVDPALAPLVESLGSARQRLANLWVRGPGSGPPERWRKLVEEVRLEREQAERNLAAASAAFRDRHARQEAGLAGVVAALPVDTALVAVFRHSRSGVGTPEKPDLSRAADAYTALVQPAGGGDPVAVPLGEAAEIDALVARWRTSVSAEAAGGADLARSVGAGLRERAWDPVVPRLGPARRVLFVPDGALALVNVAALPSRDGRWLVETRPWIQVLSAERDLVRPSETRPPEAALLAMGGPAYDDPSTFAALAPADRKPVEVATLGTGLRGTRSACADLESATWAPLPGAAAEADEVQGTWTRRREGSATRLVGADATESAFKRGVAGRSVLHLATHAFFAGATCESAAGSLQSRGLLGGTGDGDDLRRPLVGENPLLLSGLVLAGANLRAAAGPGEEDGILTAEEIASLDLSSCEWAVLSACGTGLGAVEAGEGILGLQRAFAMAGAHTVVMSLWSVDDEATRRWMRELYRARLERDLDAASCVREASLAVLRDRRARGLDDSPFWWGAFVASGDGR